MSQRRAGAAVLMAETSLQSASKSIATADRYQVIVSVDAADLSAAHKNNMRGNTTSCTSATNAQADANDTTSNNAIITGDALIPTKRPTIRGAGPIALETAKRMTCDCSLSVIKTVNGEPIDIGRKSRIWPNAIERAIKERDQRCVWPGCTQSRHLHIHHIKHWADGGATSVKNGACLCSHHHTLVHEGGYSIQYPKGHKHVDNNDQRMHEQFVLQQRTSDNTMFDFEEALRNSKASFNAVRKLSPTQYRFRIVDPQGVDILDRLNVRNLGQSIKSIDCAENRPINQPPRTLQQSHQYPHQPIQSTRVECNEAGTS